ncbi:MAG: hypothetical protein SNH55_05510 [Rikenellaceae bacterium]
MKRALLILLPLLLLCIGTVSAESNNETTEEQEAQEELTPFQERRVDRQINKKKFIYKGEYILGASASHSSISSENAAYLTLITDISAEGSITTIKPFGAYFYRDNRAVGVRYGYQKYSGLIESTTLDLGETNDLSFDVPYINFSNKSNSFAIFHRAYAPLDNKGNFGVFAEVELAAAMGDTIFEYENDGVIKSTHSENQCYDLSFNPGIAAFIMHNVSASLSFQLGGLNYTYIEQFDESGNKIGSRESSKMRFMFNILAVNFGVTVHLW